MLCIYNIFVYASGLPIEVNVPVNRVNIPVNNIMPTPISRAALARLTHGSHFLNFLKAIINLSIAIVDMMKGLANPAE
jgi:hypothetical protein